MKTNFQKQGIFFFSFICEQQAWLDAFVPYFQSFIKNKQEGLNLLHLTFIYLFSLDHSRNCVWQGFINPAKALITHW